MKLDYESDIAAVQSIDAVPSILDVVCRTTGMGFAAVARVTEDRWIACGVQDDIAFGLEPGGELKVETTICHEIRQSGEAVIINNVSENCAYRDHATPAMYGFQSYISMPIRLRDGTFFGTLCAIDPRPAKLDKPEVIAMFKLFADLIAFHLDAFSRLATSEASLTDERRNSELREQFIAVLGHDLRNPLASLDAGVRLLMKEAFDEKPRRILQLMRESAARMTGLIDNILDFARGRLGEGLSITVEPDPPIRQVLDHVLDEFRITRPDRRIESKVALEEPVPCDPSRIAQLLSNLLGNAITHGDPGQPVRVEMRSGGGIFHLAVANAGAPIPIETRKMLFQPFFRPSDSVLREGLGLGLYIVAEIAKIHRGEISVTSDADETRFTLEMPTTMG
jgi:signal transduction histidine kinase